MIDIKLTSSFFYVYCDDGLGCKQLRIPRKIGDPVRIRLDKETSFDTDFKVVRACEMSNKLD